jgi:hypothetical protein
MKKIGPRREARKDLISRSWRRAYCKGYPRVKLTWSARAFTHDTKAKSDSSPTWRCSDGMIQQKIWKKLEATNTEFLRVLRMPEWPLSGQIVQAILAWSYRLGRTANHLQFFSFWYKNWRDFTIQYIYIYIYIFFICYIGTLNLLYNLLFFYLRQIFF